MIASFCFVVLVIVLVIVVLSYLSVKKNNRRQLGFTLAFQIKNGTFPYGMPRCDVCPEAFRELNTQLTRNDKRKITMTYNEAMEVLYITEKNV